MLTIFIRIDNNEQKKNIIIGEFSGNVYDKKKIIGLRISKLWLKINKNKNIFLSEETRKVDTGVS